MIAENTRCRWQEDLLGLMPARVARALAGLPAEVAAGVTELHVRPAVDTPEQRAFDDSWSHRVDDHHLICFDEQLPIALERAGATRIGYRVLRDLQRRG